MSASEPQPSKRENSRHDVPTERTNETRLRLEMRPYRRQEMFWGPGSYVQKLPVLIEVAR